MNIKTQDELKNISKKHIILILHNLRSAYNVGAIIRTAECLNIEEVFFCGYTATPAHPKIAKTAMGAQNYISWRHFNNTEDAIICAKNSGYYIYALETIENAESVFIQENKENIAILVGNEALGIPVQLIALCDKPIILPISGWKNSLNVSAAVTVALFHFCS